MTRAPDPMRLSVVIAASNDLLALEKCLVSLRGQGEDAGTEVIVVSNFNGPAEEKVRKEFPFVKCVTLPGGTTVPELRTRGINLAHGEIVSLVEDYCTLDEHWCEEIKKAHQLPYSVIGGAVENRAPDKLLNWAVYFYDYGKYMLPAQPGAFPSLSGMNASYKREALKEVQETFREGFHETFVHDELKRRGHQPYLAPSAIVYLSKDFEFGRTFIGFYHLARSFAGRRAARSPLANRALFALGSCVLPILLPARIVLRTLPKRRHLQKLFLSLPHLFLLMASWSAGEFSGYLFGEGASARKWT